MFVPDYRFYFEKREALYSLSSKCLRCFSIFCMLPSVSVVSNVRIQKKTRFYESFFCGANGNRTSDTRIFSPLLYQLSYGTIIFACAKIELFLIIFLIFYRKNKKRRYFYFKYRFLKDSFYFSQTLCIFVPAKLSAGCSTVG